MSKSSTSSGLQVDEGAGSGTEGVFTTHKLQSLLDCGFAVGSRRELVEELRGRGHAITIHGVEAWFRHVDSNYSLPRDSLASTHPSYAVPKRRWAVLADIFGLDLHHLDLDDAAFRRWYFGQHAHPDQSRDIPELIGRESELGELADAYGQAEKGPSTRFFLVEGTAGVGKSALLGSAAWLFRSRGALVLRTAGVEHEESPLLPVLNLVEAHRDEMRLENDAAAETIDGLFRSFGPVDLANGLVARLKRAFVELTTRRTLAIIVDDAHWADSTTIRFLSLFAGDRPPGQHGILVLLAARPDAEQAAWPVGLGAATRKARLLRLEALDPSQSAIFVSRRLGEAASQAFHQWMWAHTLGNPLHMEQMLAHLHRTQRLDPMREPTGTDVPPNIAAVLKDCVELLSPPAKQLVEFASVVGATFRVSQLQYLHGRATTKQVIDCLEEAEVAGVVAYERDLFRFSHPLARQTIYDSLPESRRARFHVTVSERLAAQPQASSLGSLEAANHLLRGRTIANPDLLVNACVRASRVARRIEAWDQVVRFAKAALEIDEAPRQLAPVVRREMERLAGDGLHQSGNPRDAITYLLRVSRAYEQADDVVETSRALASVCRIRSNYGLRSEDQSRDIDTLTQAAPVLRRADPALAAWALDTIGFHFYYANDLDRAERFNTDALALVGPDETSRERSLILVGAGVLALARAEPLTACRYFRQAEAAGRSAGDRGAVVRSLQRLAVAELALGRLDEVGTTAEVLRNSEEDTVQTGEQTLVHAAELTALALQGRSEAATRVYAEARASHSRPGYQPAIGMLHGARTAAVAMAGEFEAARDLVADDSLWQTRAAVPGGPFASLRRRLRLLIDDCEASGDEIGEPIPGDLLLRPPTRQRYFGNVSTFAIGLEIAIRRSDVTQIRVAMPVIAEAFRRGTAVTPVWPAVCAFQLARAAFALGDVRTARTYLPVALDIVRRANARPLVEPAAALADRLGVGSLP